MPLALETTNTVHLNKMAFKFFTVPIQDSGSAEAEINGFLRSHRVLSVDRRWVEQGPSSFWSFCIDYLEPASGGSGPGRPGPAPRGKHEVAECEALHELAGLVSELEEDGREGEEQQDA